MHCTPTGAWHTPSPQTNPSALAQQSSSVVQDALLVQRVQHCMKFVVPSDQGVQGSPSLHCAVVVHVAPGASVPQNPELQVKPEQQSASWAQAAFAALQHVPPLQELPLQQSVAVAHVEPAAEQVWHDPSLQMFEQQSDASVQVLPSFEQLPHEPL